MYDLNTFFVFINTIKLTLEGRALKWTRNVFVTAIYL